MDIVLDTCLYVRNDSNQSAVPGFNYAYLQALLKDKNNNVYISGFSLPEIFAIRNYKNVSELMNDLSTNKVNILEYDFSNLNADFTKYDVINAYFACAFYHLTAFLEYFVLQVVLPLNLDDIEKINETIYFSTEDYHKAIGSVDFKSFTTFMKEKSIEYIVNCIKSVFLHHGKSLTDKDVWKIISATNINGGIPFHCVDISCYRYGKYLIELFKKKLKNKAKTIKMNLGIIDMLIAHASKDGYIVVSSDKDLSEYLCRYGNALNKAIVNNLWNSSSTNFK